MVSLHQKFIDEFDLPLYCVEIDRCLCSEAVSKIMAEATEISN